MRSIKIIAVFLAALMLSVPFVNAATIKEFIYDANGNRVTGDGFYREYDEFNQLVKVRQDNSTGPVLEEYVWHPIEERILIKYIYSNNTRIETVYYVNENFVQVENSTGTYNFTYVYHEGQLIAQNADGVKYYLHPDHLGSTTLITDQNGNVVCCGEYLL